MRKRLFNIKIHPEVIFLLVAGVAIGLFLAGDYGLTWDEYSNEVYAEDTIEMYLGQRVPGQTFRNKSRYGPAFVVSWLVIRNLLVKIAPSLTYTEAGRLVYWLAFIPAPIMIYDLARRIASRRAATASALLLATQPLIFAHAFTNPKDTPFMTAMIGSVWTGLWASDLLAVRDTGSFFRTLREMLGRLISRWNSASTRVKIVMGGFWIAFLAIAADTLTTHFIFLRFQMIIQNAYGGSAVTLVQVVFDRIAQDAWKTPLSLYFEKARSFYLWVRFPFYIGGISLLVILTSRALGYSFSRKTIYKTRTYWSWIIAAVALGLCTSIRVFGPFSGVMVSAYALYRYRRRALLPIAIYWLLSLVTIYISWPSLWGSPLQLFTESVFSMAKFKWEGYVLYEGVHHLGTRLPWHFVPHLILIRLTIPALLLGLVGIIIAFGEIKKRSSRSEVLALAVVWFFVPLGVIFLFDVIIYSAFRQVMFVFPGLLILTSIALDKILSIFKKPIWAAVVIALTLAPGIVGITQLHPYEIVYFNEFVGGVSGARGRFYVNAGGLDYREAVEFINQIAPADALVFIHTREHHTMTPFARDDIMLRYLSDEMRLSPPPGSFIVHGGEDRVHPDAEILYRIERAGVTLLSVSRVPLQGY